MSAVLIPVKGAWEEIKPFETEGAEILLGDRLSDKGDCIRVHHMEPELELTTNEHFIVAVLVHGANKKIMDLMGYNAEACEVLGLEHLYGPVLVFKETKAGKVGQLSIKNLSKKSQKDTDKAPALPQVMKKRPSPDSMGGDEKSNEEDQVPKIIPDSTCDRQCGLAAVYPIINIKFMDMVQEMTYCAAHHFHWQKRAKEAKTRTKKKRKVNRMASPAVEDTQEKEPVSQ